MTTLIPLYSSNTEPLSLQVVPGTGVDCQQYKDEMITRFSDISTKNETLDVTWLDAFIHAVISSSSFVI